MIESFSVGAVFKIIDQATPALRKMLAEMRALNAEIKSVTKMMEGFAKLPGMSGAVAGVANLERSWLGVADAARTAQASMASAAKAAAAAGRAAVPAGVVAAGGGGRGGARKTWFAPPIPSARGVAGGAAALLGYGIYEGASLEDYEAQSLYHAGLPQTAANREMIGKNLQDAQKVTGYGIHDIGDAALVELRMMRGTKEGGLGILPAILKGAATEARLKGTSVDESVKSLVGLAHMTGSYTPQAIEKLIPEFALLSSMNPDSLSSMERAAGYAVPILQSGLGVDPTKTLAMGTALTRAGITSTKSGTWLRELMMRAFPGTSLQSQKAFEKHAEGLRKLGLVDDNDKPTFLDDKGIADPLKLLGTLNTNLSRMAPSERAGVLKAVLGSQGAGAAAVLSGDNVREQVKAIMAEIKSPELINRVKGWNAEYESSSTKQSARTTLEQFNVLLADIGTRTLPAVNEMLKGVRDALAALEKVLPGDKFVRSTSDAVWGGLGGAGIGFLAGGPPGALVGGVVGASGGAGVPFVSDYFGHGLEAKDADTQSMLKDLKAAQSDTGAAVAAVLARDGKREATVPTVSMTINLDGTMLANGVVKAMTQHEPTSSAFPDQLGTPQPPAGN